MKRVSVCVCDAGMTMCDSEVWSLNFVFFFGFAGLASVRPEPVDKESFIKTQTYDLSYQSALPEVYSWPKM